MEDFTTDIYCSLVDCINTFLPNLKSQSDWKVTLLHA